MNKFFHKRNVIIGLALIVVVAFTTFGFTHNAKKEKAETVKEIQKSGLLQKFFEEKSLQAQSQADDNYAKKTEEIEDSYPWLDQLPIYEKTFFVFFNVKQKQFTVDIFNTKDPEDEKAKVIKLLESKNIPTTKYPLVWVIEEATPSAVLTP